MALSNSGYTVNAFTVPRWGGAAPPRSLVEAGDARQLVTMVPAPEETSIGNLGVSAVAVSIGGVVASRGMARRQHRAERTKRGFFAAEAPKTKAAGPLALPMLPPPAYREFGDTFLGEADAGFDPLSLASTSVPFWDGKLAYWNYREAEVKHGRLAMLASVGWLASEAFEPGLAKRFGLPDELATNELAPSLLNGGLGNLPALFLPAVLAIAGWIELAPQRKDARTNSISYKPQFGRVPGDYGFDPLTLAVQARAAFGKDMTWMHNAELKHGRLGMIAITFFVIQEVAFKTPVLTQDVKGVDVGIDLIDNAFGLNIPDIPLP